MLGTDCCELVRTALAGTTRATTVFHVSQTIAGQPGRALVAITASRYMHGLFQASFISCLLTSH